MNTKPIASETPPALQPRRRKWGVVKVGLLIVLAMICSWTVYGMVFNGDIKSARKAAAKAVPGEWDRKFEMSAGPVILGLARTVVSFIENVPPEARTALNAVKGAGVSIYRLHEGAPEPARETLFENADRVMERRGWERLAGVIHEHGAVAVYTPIGMKNAEDAAVCVVVKNRDSLVVVSARADLEEILALAMKHLNEEKRWEEGLRWKN